MPRLGGTIRAGVPLVCENNLDGRVARSPSKKRQKLASQNHRNERDSHGVMKSHSSRKEAGTVNGGRWYTLRGKIVTSVSSKVVPCLSLFGYMDGLSCINARHGTHGFSLKERKSHSLGLLQGQGKDRLTLPEPNLHVGRVGSLFFFLPPSRRHL